jgi:dTDP-4-dehydrorhamnose reductase
VSALDRPTTLVTGGSGLLGSAFRARLPQALFPSSAEFDVRDPAAMAHWLEGRTLHTVIHAAAFTSPPKVDQEPLRALETNVLGTAHLARLCTVHDWRMVYISTDYVFKGDRGFYTEEDPVFPVNRYAWSKLGGECAVRLVPRHLIIRTSFGPDVFPYPKAFADQWTSRQGVSPTADQMLALVESGAEGTVHLGGPRRSVMEYARSLDPGRAIEPLARADVPFATPADTSLDTTRYHAIVGGKKE